MSVLERAIAWRDRDPESQDRAELNALIERAEAGDGAALADLTDRFQGPLAFGTAGLRGILGAGESRMNTAVVLRATWGLCRYLLETIDDAAERGLVIGRDGRLRSEALAEAAAEVALALGLRVHFFEGPTPTPLVAFGVKTLRAAGGVVVTASHNPPEYNGYKVYLDQGAQIVPPHDAGIAGWIERAPPADQIARTPRAEAGERASPANALESNYLDAVAGLCVAPPTRPPKIAYTALHGVGDRLAREALRRAGFPEVLSVPEQAEPDGRFPTVRFPNPEEPGAMDLVLELATRSGADLVLANDPDADRLAAAVPDGQGGFQRLDGNEIGVLLGHHLLTRSGAPSPDDLVVTTVVSSGQLRRVAEDLGARFAETLTGFKWIVGRALELERDTGARFLFGYEEALGYTAGGVTRDKDGIGAAVVFAELASQGPVLERLWQIRERHGFFRTLNVSVVLPGREGAAERTAAMQRLRTTPPPALGGQAVTRVRDLSLEGGELPPSDVLIFELEGGARAAIRPSGTEPKIKLYLEVVEQVGGDRDAAETRADRRLVELAADVRKAAGLAPD